MNAAARNKQLPENIPVSASIFPCPYGWSSSAGLSDKRKPAQVITELKMSLADSIPSATSAYELPTTPTPILMIISETLMQIARIPRPSDSDVDGMVLNRAGLVTCIRALDEIWLCSDGPQMSRFVDSLGHPTPLSCNLRLGLRVRVRMSSSPL